MFRTYWRDLMQSQPNHIELIDETLLCVANDSIDGRDGSNDFQAIRQRRDSSGSNGISSKSSPSIAARRGEG